MNMNYTKCLLMVDLIHGRQILNMKLLVSLFSFQIKYSPPKTRGTIKDYNSYGACLMWF